MPAIVPNPDVLAASYDMNALAQATHFTGREREIALAQVALLQPKPADFVVLHGTGGAGKTALARAVADRIGWHFDDRGLAVSFETFARFEGEGEDERLVVNAQFAGDFAAQLARFYGLDAARYDSLADLQDAIAQQRQRQRALLALDNVETLLDALRDGDVHARGLAAFVKKLRAGDGAVLLTRRDVPPEDWGSRAVIEVEGLSDGAGARLFHSLLSERRRGETLVKDAEPLSRRVGGLPLSIRLLAARFNETGEPMTDFVNHIADELAEAEQLTPDSLRDAARHRTQVACVAYSVKRLSRSERDALAIASLFPSPFLAESFSIVLNDSDNFYSRLMRLCDLALLVQRESTFENGRLVRFEMNPIVRWYTASYVPRPDPERLSRLGEAYQTLARQAYESFEDRRMQLIIRDSLPVFEEAFKILIRFDAMKHWDLRGL